MSGETLSDQVNRAKARWLKRVMYRSACTSIQKVLAYAIADHLNCVTLDCWPSQNTLTGLLGRRSGKTPQRAARGLRSLNFITIHRGPSLKSCYRYAPVFIPEDWDRIGNGKGQKRPENADKDVHQSILSIQFESSSTAFLNTRKSFSPASRGAIEIKLAEMLGPHGTF